jgi:hypothetical protein
LKEEDMEQKEGTPTLDDRVQTKHPAMLDIGLRYYILEMFRLL